MDCIKVKATRVSIKKDALCEVKSLPLCCHTTTPKWQLRHRMRPSFCVAGASVTTLMLKASETRGRLPAYGVTQCDMLLGCITSAPVSGSNSSCLGQCFRSLPSGDCSTSVPLRDRGRERRGHKRDSFEFSLGGGWGKRGDHFATPTCPHLLGCPRHRGTIRQSSARRRRHRAGAAPACFP